jgi:hypothetical protein
MTQERDTTTHKKNGSVEMPEKTIEAVGKTPNMTISVAIRGSVEIYPGDIKELRLQIKKCTVTFMFMDLGCRGI